MTAVLLATRSLYPYDLTDLYQVNPATASLVSIGPTGFGVACIAQDPTDGTLYGLTITNDATVQSLITIAENGAGTAVGELGLTFDRLLDMAFDSAGNLFGWFSQGGLHGLYSIDKVTGAATPLGGGTVGDVAYGGLAFDALDVLLCMPNGDVNIPGHLYTLNTSTGARTNVATLNGFAPTGTNDPVICGATFDEGGTLYALDVRIAAGPGISDVVDLITVDPTTAAVAHVAVCSESMVSGLAFAVGFVPAPVVSVPDLPTLDSATPGRDRVTIRWTPGDDGGTAVTGFNIYRAEASGDETLLTLVTVVTAYTDEIVVAGTEYFYEVSAINAVGEGALSNELSATPYDTILVPIVKRKRFLSSKISQALTIKFVQNGPSDVTEIHLVELAARPLDPAEAQSTNES